MVVYSRWCGKLISDIQHCGAKRGLSPLARGTLAQAAQIQRVHRFIPAGAGNSAFIVSLAGQWPVYPRWRGELQRAAVCDVLATGLSPLARGTLLFAFLSLILRRFIPARAGNSPQDSHQKTAKTVYPRSRGELDIYCCATHAVCGLSPLARGTL